MSDTSSTREREPAFVTIALTASACTLLLARPALIARADPAVVLALVLGTLLLLGVCWPVRQPARVATSGTAIAVTMVGLVTIVIARLLVGGHPPTAVAHTFIALDLLAAVAEEAFFRRLLYGWLRPHGVTLAMVGSATSFAIVHVTTYGWRVLPLDLVAGLLFAWQRETSGSWLPSALTHACANLLAVW